MPTSPLSLALFHQRHLQLTAIEQVSTTSNATQLHYHFLLFVIKTQAVPFATVPGGHYSTSGPPTATTLPHKTRLEAWRRDYLRHVVTYGNTCFASKQYLHISQPVTKSKRHNSRHWNGRSATHHRAGDIIISRSKVGFSKVSRSPLRLPDSLYEHASFSSKDCHASIPKHMTFLLSLFYFYGCTV